MCPPSAPASNVFDTIWAQIDAYLQAIQWERDPIIRIELMQALRALLTQVNSIFLFEALWSIDEIELAIANVDNIIQSTNSFIADALLGPVMDQLPQYKSAMPALDASLLTKLQTKFNTLETSYKKLTDMGFDLKVKLAELELAFEKGDIHELLRVHNDYLNMNKGYASLKVSLGRKSDGFKEELNRWVNARVDPIYQGGDGTFNDPAAAGLMPVDVQNLISEWLMALLSSESTADSDVVKLRTDGIDMTGKIKNALGPSSFNPENCDNPLYFNLPICQQI